VSNQDRTETVRAILLQDWDPLIVGDNPNLADEYDRYLPEIIRLLNSDCTIEQMEAYLASIERDKMWLPRLTQGIPRTAENLVSSWAARP
jgi:hypothetical protein